MRWAFESKPAQVLNRKEFVFRREIGQKILLREAVQTSTWEVYMTREFLVGGCCKIIPCNFHTFWACKKSLCMKFHPLHLIVSRGLLYVLHCVINPFRLKIIMSTSPYVQSVYLPDFQSAGSMYHLPKYRPYMHGRIPQSISQTALNNEQGFEGKIIIQSTRVKKHPLHIMSFPASKYITA